MEKTKSVVVSVAFVAILTALAIMISSMVAQTVRTQTSKDDNDKEKLARIKATFPVTDYALSELETPEQKAKGRKYDVIPNLNPDVMEDSRDVIINEWAHDLTALPVEKSQVVVLGTVVDAKAHLSERKQTVYSEFKIQAEKVFKNDTRKDIGLKIYAERQGGIVRFPSGVESWVLVEGQGMPVLQKRYLFFLSYDAVGVLPQKSDLSILTAYEIRDGRSFPLDNPGGGSHPIATTYTGKEDKYLFTDLARSVK